MRMLLRAPVLGTDALLPSRRSPLRALALAEDEGGPDGDKSASQSCGLCSPHALNCSLLARCAARLLNLRSRLPTPHNHNHNPTLSSPPTTQPLQPTPPAPRSSTHIYMYVHTHKTWVLASPVL